VGYQEIGTVPHRAHRCDLPGSGGVPGLQAVPVLIPDGQVIRCDCGRAWVSRGMLGWKRARWWTVRRAERA
jgi:hypothetical protein